ncbi:MAG: hypothetical protein M1343_05260 [Chloroflexi bacterium]|nr:hypothetical protein [Chloroflexota bacterium]
MEKEKQKRFVREQTHAGVSAVECFKCGNCGAMFATEEQETRKCPVCGRVDNRREDEIVWCSIEEF